VKIILSLKPDLVRELRRVARERHTTLAALVETHVKELVAEKTRPRNKIRERDALERAFERFQFRVGKRIWKRSELHDRPR
jgi:hypothetical protein